MFIWICKANYELVDLGKYKCAGYEFDSRSEFLFTDGSFGKNIIIFRADRSSFVHIDNKGKYILVIDEGTTQRLDDIILTAEAIYKQDKMSLSY